MPCLETVTKAACSIADSDSWFYLHQGPPLRYPSLCRIFDLGNLQPDDSNLNEDVQITSNL